MKQTLSFFNSQKKNIVKYLSKYIDENFKKFPLYHVNELSIKNRLIDFLKRGKMIRGGLVILSYSLFSKEINTCQMEEVVKISAAVELFQSALLIHDDIIDKDIKRRGTDSIFYQYVKIAKNRKLREAHHTGQSLGICAGDIVFFLASNLLSKIKIKPNILRDILIFCSQELFYVAGSQMLDIYWGSGNKIIEEDAIINLYRYKTGRYTFSLPLKVGALVTGAGSKTLKTIEKIGELLGIIFQIKDDDIGIFGTEAITGKPVGSDLKEGKKTLYLSILYQKADKYLKDKLNSLVGVPKIKEKDIRFIKDNIQMLGVRDHIFKMIKEQSESIKILINSLPSTNNKAKKILYALVEYNLKRDK